MGPRTRVDDASREVGYDGPTGPWSAFLNGSATVSKRVQIVVLDDDPTGIQTVHGCLLLTRWRKELLREGFEHQQSFFYVLTNTRAHEPQRVRRIVREVVQNTLELNREYGRALVFVSRSDSTLRSHFPIEIDVIARAMEEEGTALDAIFMVPALFEGGRLTAGDVQYVVDGGRRVPAAQTEYRARRRLRLLHLASAVLHQGEDWGESGHRRRAQHSAVDAPAG